MVRAQSADGVIHEFPDGTPDAVIDRAMKAYVGQQTKGEPKAAPQPKGKGFFGQVGDTMAGAFEKVRADAAEAPQKPSGNVLKDFGTGFGRTARNAADLGALIASPATGVMDAAVIEPGAKVLDKIPLDAYRAPQLRVDRSGVRLDGPEKLDEAGKHQANRNIVNSALSAAKPGTLKGAPIPVAPGGNALTGKIAAFDQAGVTPSLAATAGGKGSAAVTNAVAENTIAGAAVRGRLRRNLGEVAASADRVAQGYGSDRGAQIAGENVQAGVQRFAKDRTVSPTRAASPAQATSFAAKAGKLYDDAFAAIPDQPVKTPNATQTLKDILGRVSAPNLAETMKSPKVAQIADALAKDTGQVSFTDLRELRTWVRDARKSPELRQNIGEADLGRLEGALTDDIMGNASALGGPEAASKLRRADQFYRAGSDRIGSALKSFDKASSGEGAYTRIIQAAGSGSSADAQKLLSLKRSLAPDEWGDVAATTIKRLGQPTRGGAQGVPGPDDFSISTFVSNYAGMSPRGREILFGSIGGGGKRATDLKSEMDNLVNVAGALKGVEKGANASKTAVNAQAVATLGGVVTNFPLTAKLLGGMALTGEVMTNPVAVRWVASLSRASQVGSQALKSQLGRLRIAAEQNRALLPVYEAASQAVIQAQAPARLAAPAVAEPAQEQTPPTR